MNLSFLKLSHLKANDANLAANDYLQQSIALTTITGFTHLLERWFNQHSCSIRFAESAVLPIIHSVSTPRGFPKSSTYDYGSRNKAGTPRLLYQYQGNLEFSLIIAFYCDDDGNAPHELNSSTQLQFINYLNRQHFSGGTLLPISAEQVTFHRCEDEPEKTVKRLINTLQADGYVLEDISHQLTHSKQANHHDTLDQLLHLIARKNSQDSNSQENNSQEINSLGFCVPAAIGFLLLEEPQYNRIQRHPDQNYAHAFVEPMLGAIRLRSVGSFKKQYQNSPIPVWWQYQEHDQQLFVKAITTDELIDNERTYLEKEIFL